jgi:hypothetical protein
MSPQEGILGGRRVLASVWVAGDDVLDGGPQDLGDRLALSFGHRLELSVIVCRQP